MPPQFLSSALGGYNRGRSAAAGIRNAYASDALLCPSGEQRHPKYDHLKEFHRAIAEISEALINAPSALNTPQTVEVILNRTEEAPIWITGLQQRMFAYSGVNSSSDKDVLFIENDADTLERVRVTKNVDFVIEMQPHSAVIVVGGGEIILFDSASISIEAKQFERKTTVVNDNLDWKSWLEPIGESKHKFISKDGLKEQTSTLQQLAVSSDYLWYSTDLIIEHHFTNARMKIITEKAVAILVFIDEQFIGGADNHEHGEGWVELIVPCGGLTAGSHKLSILSESLGHYNLIGRWGAKTTAKSKGLYEVLLLDETGTHGISSQTWQMSAGFLENNEPRNSMVSNTEGHDDLVAHSGTRPKWSVAYFTTPEYDILKQRLFVNIKSGRGHLYINGHDLGRFWNITRSHQQELYSQQYYYLPTDWLQVDKALNELKIFDVYGSDLSSVSIILSWVAFNNSISPGMIDEVDFVDACLI